MFLYNLKDAIEELPPDSGVQIHRSHWVSKKHVKQVLKKKGNAECILSCGKSLPVSRRKYAEVKELLAYKIP
jgi:DNA-binding LytR/AlgR family response regulator